MGFFNKYNKTEQALLELYSKLLPNTDNMVQEMLDKAIDDSKKEGMYNLPSNLGDTFLKREKTEEAVKEKFRKKREEGVKDNDIRWWFNLNDIERRMILKVDELNRMVLFMEVIKQGKTEAEADSIVRKAHPIYGDLNDERLVKGDDRPLPFELKDRINIYIQKRFENDSEQYKREIEGASTFNALVRKEIKAGKL